MKYISKLIICVGVVTMFVVGCNTKELQDLNLNPQAINQVNLNFMFSPVQLASAAGGGSGDNRYTDWRTNIGMCSYAIQHLANGGQGGIAPGDTYTDNFETAEALFQFIYGDELPKLYEIIKQTSDGGYDAGNKQNLKDASRIMRAFLYARVTDYYGSVPFTEAEQAGTSDQIFFPKYDKQKDIYAALLKELDEASADLSTSRADEGFSAADLYYNGDITKWKKWGYSLMLRLAMKISNVDAATANTYIAKAVAGGVFTSNDDNVWCPMATGPSVWTNQNGISRAFYPGDGGQPTYLSRTLVDFLKGPNAGSTADDDPRLMVISGGIGSWSIVAGTSTWTPTATGMDPLNQKGMPNGLNASTLLSQEGVSNPDITYSKINIKMLDFDDPYLMMNYGEVAFLQAEASERSLGGLNPGQAAAFYMSGLKASLQMYTPYDASLAVDDATADAYVAANPYVAGSTGLTMIGTQLWVNHFLNWYEAWGDWRRTLIPVLTPVVYPGNVTGGQIPQRLKYPVREVSGNPNFENGSTKPNTYVTKVWWAGGPE